MNLTLRKPKTWPYAASSTGRPRGALPLGSRNILVFEAIGEARDTYNSKVIKAIQEYLNDNAHDLRTSGRMVVFSLFMMGTSAEKTKPMVMFVSEDEPTRTKAFRIINKSGIMKEFPGFDIGQMDLKAEFEYLKVLGSESSVCLDCTSTRTPGTIAGDELPDVFASKKEPIVGTRLQVHLQTGNGAKFSHAVAGGLIRQEGTYYLHTVSHFLFPTDTAEGNTSGSASPSNGEDVNPPEALVSWDATGLSDFDDSTDDQDNDDLVQATSRGSATPPSNQSESWLFDSDAPSPQRLLDTAEQDTFPATLASRFEEFTARHGTSHPPESPAMKEEMVRVGRVSMLNKRLDSALIELDTGSLDVSQADLEDIALPLDEFLDNTSPPPTTDCPVRLATPNAGSITGTLSATPSLLCLPHSKTFETAYVAKLTRPLAPGDCGTWVRHATTGKVVGYVVAGSLTTGLVMILPAKNIIETVCLGRRVGKCGSHRGVSLVTTDNYGPKFQRDVDLEHSDALLQSEADQLLSRIKRRNSPEISSEIFGDQSSAIYRHSRKRTKLDGRDEDDSDANANLDRLVSFEEIDGSTGLLACPFHKYDAVRYGVKHKDIACVRPGFRSIRKLKEHLKRKHSPVQCQRCYNTFSGSLKDPASGMAQLAIHSKTADCRFGDPSKKEGIDDFQWATLDKQNGGKNQEAHRAESWYEIWDVLFPNVPRPSSPWEILIDSRNSSWTAGDADSRSIVSYQPSASTAATSVFTGDGSRQQQYLQAKQPPLFPSTQDPSPTLVPGETPQVERCLELHAANRPSASEVAQYLLQMAETSLQPAAACSTSKAIDEPLLPVRTIDEGTRDKTLKEDSGTKLDGCISAENDLPGQPLVIPTTSKPGNKVPQEPTSFEPPIFTIGSTGVDQKALAPLLGSSCLSPSSTPSMQPSPTLNNTWNQTNSATSMSPPDWHILNQRRHLDSNSVIDAQATAVWQGAPALQSVPRLPSLRQQLLKRFQRPTVRGTEACWRCINFHTRCEGTGTPCNRCRSDYGNLSIPCRRGPVCDAAAEIPFLCHMPRSSSSLPKTSLPPDLQPAAEFLSNASKHRDRTAKQLTGREPEAGSNYGLFWKVLNTKVPNIRFLNQFSELDISTPLELPYDELIAAVVWELEDNPEATQLTGVRSVEDLVVLLEAACLCEAEFGHHEKSRRLVYNSICCLKSCLEALRLSAHGLLTADNHTYCSQANECISPAFYGVTKYALRYAKALTSELFHKHRLKKNRWLLLFYSLCVQKHVRRGFMSLEERLQSIELSAGGIEAKAPERPLHSVNYLQEAISLFHQISLQNKGKLAKKLLHSKPKPSVYIQQPPHLSQAVGGSSIWQNWPEEGISEFLGRIFEIPTESSASGNGFDSDTTITDVPPVTMTATVTVATAQVVGGPGLDNADGDCWTIFSSSENASEASMIDSTWSKTSYEDTFDSLTLSSRLAPSTATAYTAPLAPSMLSLSTVTLEPNGGEEGLEI